MELFIVLWHGYNLLFGLEFIVFWIGDMQHGSCVLGQLGLADKPWIVYTTKGAGQRLQSFCEMEIHDDIVGRQYRLLRWMVFD